MHEECSVSREERRVYSLLMFLMELERPSVWSISLRVKLVFRTKRYQAQVNMHMYLDRQTNAVSKKKMNELIICI